MKKLGFVEIFGTTICPALFAAVVCRLLPMLLPLACRCRCNVFFTTGHPAFLSSRANFFLQLFRNAAMDPQSLTMSPSFNNLVLAAFLTLSVAHLSTAAFVAVPQHTLIDPSLLHLARASALRIPYNPIAYNSTVADLPAFRLSLDALFPALTQQQFDALMSAYSFGTTKSRVTYNSSASYRFTDFLPPLLQALSTLHFHTQHHNFTLPDVLTDQLAPAVCQCTQLSINCWGFAYDVLISSQTQKPYFTLSLAHPQVAWSVLTSAAFSLPLQNSTSTPDFFTNATERNIGLQAGDYILIYHQRSTPPSTSTQPPRHVLPPTLIPHSHTQPQRLLSRPHRRPPRR